MKVTSVRCVVDRVGRQSTVSTDVSAGLVQRLLNFTRKRRRGMGRGVVKAAYFLLDKSREVVPIDTHLLQKTSRVVESGNIDKGTKAASVVYNQPYAVYQHEDLTYKHKPGRTAKYLETPARVYRAEMARIVREETAKGG